MYHHEAGCDDWELRLSLVYWKDTYIFHMETLKTWEKYCLRFELRFLAENKLDVLNVDKTAIWDMLWQ